MGDAALSDDGGVDPDRMLQRLEQLQHEREQIEGRFDALTREDDGLALRMKECERERERLEQRRVELDGETTELEARRDALEEEHRALVRTRDDLDQEYTELYAQLDAIADRVAVPAFVPPALTDRIAGVAPPRDPTQESWLVEPAPTPGVNLVAVAPPPPSRTTLVIVPDAPAAPVFEPDAPKKVSPRVVALAVGIAAAVFLAIGVATWPDDPPPATTPVDPQVGLETVRAALVPAPAETKPTPAAVEPAVSAPAPVPTQKRRAKSTRSRTDKKKKKPSPADR
jgi:hypothetical protein